MSEKFNGMSDEDNPQLNAQRLRAIVKISPAKRINIDSRWALKIAEQLELLAIIAPMSCEEIAKR